MNRLDYALPDMARQLASESSDKQRAAVIAACDLAVRRARVDAPLVLLSLETMRSGGTLSKVERDALKRLAEALDDECFRLQAVVDQCHADSSECIHMFLQARAVSAVAIAANDDSPQGVMESIYEAAASCEYPPEFTQRGTAELKEVISAAILKP